LFASLFHRLTIRNTGKNSKMGTIPTRDIATFHQNLHGWFAANARKLPWRETTDPYAILVSEFMLQQTQVATVIPYYIRWMERFPDFQALGAASEDAVLSQWQGLGYYSRARNLHRLARIVANHYDGALPDAHDLLTALPGVGDYTAGAVLSFAFNRPSVAMDANILRVLARLLNLRTPIHSTASIAKLKSLALELLPNSCGRIHLGALMELGALICAPKRPKCGSCPIRAFCATPDPESLPIAKPRKRIVRLSEICFAIIRVAGTKHELLLQQRPDGHAFAGLWMLPKADALGLSLPECPPAYTGAYPFTHHRVHLEVHTMRFTRKTRMEIPSGSQWLPLSGLPQIAIPAGHLKAVRALGLIP
jgi:A/G-specific adenine glycosylase